MKKTALFLATALTISSLLTVPVFADQLQDSFIADLSEALAERWSMSENESTMTKKEVVDYRTKVVTAETSRLDPYLDQTFENEKFNLFAHAYIEAVDNQLSSLKYYEELQDIYELEWSTGYNVRALLLPVFVDAYGLEADESIINEFRSQSSFLSGDIVLDDESDDSEETAADNEETTTDASKQDNEDIEIFNKEGITVWVTGFSDDGYSKSIDIKIQNLNHHDIIVSNADLQVVVNGDMADASLWEEVKSGKNANGHLYIYSEDIDKKLDEIKDITFAIEIIDFASFNDLYRGDQINLSVDEASRTVSPRITYNDKESIKKVQELLNACGYPCGTADGVPGKQTNSAILQFEKDHNLPEDTTITPELLESLEAASKAGQN